MEIEKISIEEKLKILTGKTPWKLDNLGGIIKTVKVSDGPNGLRKVIGNKTIKATVMPTIGLLACSWDKELSKLDGQTIAEDCIENDVDILLAPGVNIKRTPLNGRNFEYFSEDPYLSGILASEYIKGVQSSGIGASIKHYAVNNREYDRNEQSSEVDERTLREIYLKAFEIAIKNSSPWTVMCSYNLINGIYASENKKLLNDILRNEFGFEGVIVSDWGAVRNRYKSLKASLDLEMPDNKNSYNILYNAYKNGIITEEEIDSSVLRLIELSEKCGKSKKIGLTNQQKHENAVKIAEESMVLLKNEDSILPLKHNKIAVFGYTDANPILGGKGSAFAETNYKLIPMSEILDKKYGYNIIDTKYFVNNDEGNMMVKRAITDAYNSDTVILCVGETNEGEAYDRSDIKLPFVQEKLINEIAEVNSNIIVVVSSGSAIDMSGWINKVKAVLYAGYAGEGGPEAIASILSGNVNPSGKLAETFPLSLNDTYCKNNVGNGFYERYDDCLLVGYRYYDYMKKDVLFSFGYGLSYSEFKYSNPKIKKISETDYIISYNITNVSQTDGCEISEIYVNDVFSNVCRPYKELKAFSKDFIRKGETKTISVKLSKDAFSYYNVSLEKWYIENGDFIIFINSSSLKNELKLKITINLEDETQFSFE